MLEKVILQNVESHELTVFDFVDGVNAITGISDAGKSGAMRGIRCLLRNNPSPESIRRTGADKVRIVGKIDGRTIERVREGTTNRYVLDKEKLDAVGRGTPPERIEALLNMGDINFESQLDPIFLLQSSPGEVARYFNRVLGLDDIDILSSNLASLQRQNNHDIKTTKVDIDKTEGDVKKYDIYEDIMAALSKLLTKAAIVEDAAEEIDELDSLLTEYEAGKKEYLHIPDIPTGQFVDDILAYEIDYKEYVQTSAILQRMLQNEKEMENAELGLADLEDRYSRASKAICPNCGRPYK